MKVRITHNGAIEANHYTRVTDLETGQPLEYVKHVALDIPANNDPITATITVAGPEIDIIADAEIKHVCPCCGTPQKEEQQEESPFLGRD